MAYLVICQSPVLTHLLVSETLLIAALVCVPSERTLVPLPFHLFTLLYISLVLAN